LDRTSAPESSDAENVGGDADDNDDAVRLDQDVGRTLDPSDTYRDVSDRSFIGATAPRMDLIAGYGGDGSDHPMGFNYGGDGSDTRRTFRLL
jgi:hypothetical protein